MRYVGRNDMIYGMRGEPSEESVRAWARDHGFRLVRDQVVANWHPVLRDLFTEDRIIYAVKLWAEITRSPTAGLDLKRANEFITGVRNHVQAFPTGDEFPDLAADRLMYYIGEPWRGRERA